EAMFTIFPRFCVRISGVTLNPDLAKSMNLSANQRGALVAEVATGGPAEKAGLHGSAQQVTIDGQQMRVGGDVIVAVGGKPVKTFDDVVTYLSRSASVGQAFSMDVLRDGKSQTVTIIPAARPVSGPQTAQAPNQRRQAPDPQAPSQPTGGATLGIQGITVTPAIAAAMSLPANAQGVLVERVVPGSPAAQAGLRGSDKPLDNGATGVLVGGDIIVALDGQPTTTVEELRALLQKAQRRVTLTLLRNGATVQVTVNLMGRTAPSP
ncbi:MAG: PDZ domain-containing protein, partial [Chloroflexota bacterium]